MAAQLAPQAPLGAAPLDLDALWLDALQRVCARAAHELKGALNGVSVNLEVVRSRAEKPDALASALGKYATSAADQLDVVIAMTDALLSLSRAAREPVEIGADLRRLHALLGPAARSEGRQLELEPMIDALGVTSATGAAARLAIATGLLAAIDGSSDVMCRAPTDAAEPTLVIECRDGRPAALSDAAAGAVADAGIRMTAEPSAISISFPR